VALSLHRHFRSSKVPRTITPSFWGSRSSPRDGEATSDYFVNRFDPRVAVACTAVVFAAVLWWQLRLPTYRTVAYWSAVVMVSVFGTMCADVVHVEFGVAYVVSAIALALALALVFWTWFRVEGTLSIHSIVTTRRELFYWATVTVAFALARRSVTSRQPWRSSATSAPDCSHRTDTPAGTRLLARAHEFSPDVLDRVRTHAAPGRVLRRLDGQAKNR